MAHGGSVYWNGYRNRWVMITVESYGSTSMLGEIWYAEADTPLGPWVYARKVVTHDKYSFYNPKQHPMFDKDLGRIIFFEGTYTTTFSGNPDPTPRYDYNQVMYQLDLSDPRLALPVAIYQSLATAQAPATPGTEARRRTNGYRRPRRVAFFAPDRKGIATLPVYEEYSPQHGQTLRVGSPGQPGTLRRQAAVFHSSRRRQRLYVGIRAAVRAAGGGRRPQGSIRPTLRSPQGARRAGRQGAGPGLEKPGERFFGEAILFIVRGRFGGAVGVLFLGQVLAGQECVELAAQGRLDSGVIPDVDRLDRALLVD